MKTLPKTDKRSLSMLVRADAGAEGSGIDVANRTAWIALASETPYQRWWGTEILGCTPEECDVSFLNDGAPFLWNHNTNDQRGVIVPGTVKFENGVIRCQVKFSRSPEGEKLFQDVQDGIVTKISVGYEILEAELVATPGLDGEEAYRITKWRALESSAVSIPADPTVGVGRSAESEPATQTPPAAVTAVPTLPVQLKSKEAIVADENQNQTPAADPVAAERSRVQEITAIADKLGIPADEVRAAIGSGQTIDAFRAGIISKINKPVANSHLGLSQEEVRSYSLLRAIDAAASGNWSRAGYERELSEELAQRTGKTTAGFLMPMDIQARALAGTSQGAGGALVATNLQMNSFIDVQRNAQITSKLGVTTLNNLVGKIAIPKRTAAGVAYWVDPDQQVGPSGSTFGQVQMSAKTIGAYTDINRSLVKQTDMSVEAFILSSMAQDVGLAVDHAVFHGTGADGQFTGIFNTAGVQLLPLGTDGDYLTYTDAVALETLASNVNCDAGTMALVTTPGVRGYLKTTPRFANTATPIWENNQVNGYAAYASNQINKDFTKGTGSALHGGVFGDFSNVVMGNWGVLDVSVDTTTLGTSGGMRIICLQDVDMALRLAQAFAIFKDAKVA